MDININSISVGNRIASDHKSIVYTGNENIRPTKIIEKKNKTNQHIIGVENE